MNAVEVSQLEKRFGALRALADLDLCVPEAALVLVRGPNGAGKSTLLRVLAGLTRPSRGTVRVLGEDLFRTSGAATRGRVGYLGPEPGLYGELSVEENLAYCAHLHGRSRTRVSELLAVFELEPLRARRVRTLSTGYRKRTGLARALVAEPGLLLLDEPWSGLDAAASALLDAQLAALRERGGSALVAAHAPEMLAAIFDATISLEAGRRIA